MFQTESLYLDQNIISNDVSGQGKKPTLKRAGFIFLKTLSIQQLFLVLSAPEKTYSQGLLNKERRKK